MESHELFPWPGLKPRSSQVARITGKATGAQQLFLFCFALPFGGAGDDTRARQPSALP
jgi:hypothetical protein